MMVEFIMWTKGEKDQPPTAIMGFYHISMSCPLNRQERMIAVSQNWIMGTRLEWSPGTPAACQCHHVSVFGPTFGDHEIIKVANVVQMRGFRITSTRPGPEIAGFGQF